MITRRDYTASKIWGIGTNFRTHFKNVFWPNIFVGASLPRVAGFPIWSYRSCGSQILDIQQYASGLKLGPAARVPAKPLGEDGILNQNPIFEMGSIYLLAIYSPAIFPWLHRSFAAHPTAPDNPRSWQPVYRRSPFDQALPERIEWSSC
jgi:hypothetical protein